jgi:hypothetical protein
MATNKKINPLHEKFKKDQLKFERITNDDLVCKDCKKKGKMQDRLNKSFILLSFTVGEVAIRLTA